MHQSLARSHQVRRFGTRPKLSRWFTRRWKQLHWDASRTESMVHQSMAQSPQVRRFGTRPKLSRWDTRRWKQPLWDASQIESMVCQSMAQSHQVRRFGTRPKLSWWFTRRWMSRFGTRPKLARWFTSRLTTSGSLTTSSRSRASTWMKSQLNESVQNAVDLAAEREEAPAEKVLDNDILSTDCRPGPRWPKPPGS